MSPRLAPALGLAAACAMLTGVGVIAISIGDDPARPTEIAGAVLVPSSPARVAPSLAARQVATTRAKKVAPPASTTASRPLASFLPSQSPTSSSLAPVPGSTASRTTPAAAPTTTSSPAVPAGPGLTGVAPARQNSANASYESYAQDVFQAVNQARAAHHLPVLTWSPNLQASAHQHNVNMARSNTLSHQVDGEPPLGARETAAGVQWTYAAENIGWTTERTAAGALDIESRMYGETAPNDAHKRNILSTSATAIGVDVYIDAAHGRLWLTEDFSG